MRRFAVAVALLALTGTACSGEDAQEAGSASPTSSVTSSLSPSPTASVEPTETESPSPTVTLSAKDQRYVDSLKKAVLASYYDSPEEAVEDAKGLCRKLDEAGGNVTIELSASWTELEVNGYEIPIEVFADAIGYYCDDFSYLIQEYPAP